MKAFPNLLFALSISAVIVCGCSDRHPNAIPRPTAYPRLEITADSIGQPAAIETTAFRINRHAQFDLDSANSLWANIVYPASLGATAHISLSYPDNFDAAIANRQKRFALNLADAPATSEEFLIGAWECVLVYSNRPSLTTPVQFYGANPDGRFISGAVALKNPGNNADSIAPLVALLRDDMRTLLFSLQ